MEDEITKRELSDDELDNVSGGGCEENAAKLLSTMWEYRSENNFQ